MQTCHICKKKYEKVSKFSCGHLMCDRCLGRALIIDEFLGLKNDILNIEFKCICEKGIMTLSTAEYISILNKLIGEPTIKTDENNSDFNLSDELNNKLYQSILKKKKKLKHEKFEDFSKFLNVLESNLMKLFDTKVNETIVYFDSLIATLTLLKESFVKNIDSKLTKINSMFVIIKLVYYSLYQDYDNLSDIYNLKALSKIKTDFIKIKFSPNVDSLYDIEKAIKKFENEKHFLCKFIFSSKDKNITSWKPKYNLNDKLPNKVFSLIQLSNGYIASGGNDSKVHIWDIKKKSIIFSLINEQLSIDSIPIRKIIQMSNNILVYIAQSYISFWNLNNKENIHNIIEQNGTLVLNINEYNNAKIVASLNNYQIKVYNSNLFTNLYTINIPSYCYALYSSKNSYIFCGLTNGDLLVYNESFNSNNNINGKVNIIFKKKINMGQINCIAEYKGKLICGLNNGLLLLGNYNQDSDFILLNEKMNKSAITCLKFYDYKTIIYGDTNSNIFLWDFNKKICMFHIYINEGGWILDLIKLKDGMICGSTINNNMLIYNYE